MGELGRFEQIVSQFLSKSLHIILDSRIPSLHTQSRSEELVSGFLVKKSDKWFSLVLGDCPASLENLNFWHRSLMEPMIIDVILVQEESGSLSNYSSPTTLGFGKKETLIERWVVQYESVKTMSPQCGDSSASYKKIYKKSIILLRSLYAMMRLLPAYRVFRKLCSSSQSSKLDINYKVFSFSDPLPKEEEEVMKQYNFSSVEAPQGRLSLSVMFRESLSGFNLATSESFTQTITDYVGSPATDPFRLFPSSVKGVSSPPSNSKGENSPSTPFHRPNSWTSGGMNMASPLMRPLSGSPHLHRMSEVSNDCPSPLTDIYGHRVENFRLPTHHQMPSLYDCQLSPPFSPSPSPSPPAYFSGSKSIQTHLGSETAPVSILHPMINRSPRYLSPNLSDPNGDSLPPLSSRSTKLDHSSQDSPSGIRLSRKSDSSRGDSGHKVLRDSRGDSGRFSALLSSSGSPRVGFSRSSSRLSFQDECDISCPFVVDDVDSSESLSSHNLDGKRGSENTSEALSTARKSEDAAVGALVHMLKYAPPLRQNSSCDSSRSSSKLEVKGGGETALGFFMARKISDAMEELRSYRQMKEVLLSNSGTMVFASEENTSAQVNSQATGNTNLVSTNVRPEFAF